MFIDLSNRNRYISTETLIISEYHWKRVAIFKAAHLFRIRPPTKPGLIAPGPIVKRNDNYGYRDKTFRISHSQPPTPRPDQSSTGLDTLDPGVSVFASFESSAVLHFAVLAIPVKHPLAYIVKFYVNF